MQRRQSVCASVASRPALLAIVLCLLVLGFPHATPAQVNTAALSGTVVDPQGLAVRGAKLTLISSGTAAERTAVANDSGHYNFVGVPPGKYKLTVDGGAMIASATSYLQWMKHQRWAGLYSRPITAKPLRPKRCMRSQNGVTKI